jgi:hypothetical protein
MLNVTDKDLKLFRVTLLGNDISNAYKILFCVHIYFYVCSLAAIFHT